MPEGCEGGPVREEVAPPSPPQEKRLFTGKERDAETGLDYFEARYLGTSVGRFTSPDPIAGSLANPQSMNRYAYVLSNPLRYLDPTGLLVDWGQETDARDAYFARINELLNSDDERKVKRGKELWATYCRLDNDTDYVFHVTRRTGEMDSGMLEYRGEPGHLSVVLRGDSRGDSYGNMPVTQKLGHEFEHGRQFLDSEIGYRKAGDTWWAYRDDRPDEARAFAAGFAAERAQNDQGAFILGAQQAFDGGGLPALVNYLGRTGEYRNRAGVALPAVWPDGRVPPGFYAVPRIR